MREINTIAEALFDKIRSRFETINLGDEGAQQCSDPAKARFFNFDYVARDGTNFGNVTISLVDEENLKAYFGQNITNDMDESHKDEWFDFLRGLRKFARRNLLGFDTRDISKSNLQLKDIKQQSKDDSTYDVDELSNAVTESKLYGTSRNSYGTAGRTKLIIKHDGLVSDDKQGDRARHIKEIFIETERGERFLLPHTNLHAARALGQHISHGGMMHDEIGEAINSMVNEMGSMAHFVRASKRRQFEDAETTAMVEAAVKHYETLKNTLKAIRGPKGYQQFVDSYQAPADIEDEVDVDGLKERFVKKIYDSRFDDALPLVYRAYKQQQESIMAEEFENWLDTIAETAYEKPDTDEKIEDLNTLLSSPFTVGQDGQDAIGALKNIIGDDDLYDGIYQLSQSQGPDADCRFLIKNWAQKNDPQLLGRLQFGPNNTQQAQTNIQQPVSAPAAEQPTGASGMDWPTTESADPLDFIKSLAGLTK
jgi:hypothetical protein